MQRLITTGLLVLLIACDNTRPAAREATAAADLFTREYAGRELRASVAGADCNVLVISIDKGFDDDLVESLHYGTHGYDALGGVEEFAQERGFRAVVYRDRAGRLRTYGATTLDEARSVPRCR